MAAPQLQPKTDVVAISALVQRAVTTLANATSAAEILDARDMASAAYDAAKTAGRLARTKKAHDDLIGAVYRAQADALEIEAKAKRRLADEYSAAQERGEILKNSSPVPRKSSSRIYAPDAGILIPATRDEVGINRRQLDAARLIRKAELTDPGVVRRTLDDAIAAGEEPTKAKVTRAVLKAVNGGEPKEQKSSSAAAALAALIPPRESCLMAVREMILDEWLPQIPTDELGKFITDLRDEIDDIERIVRKKIG